MKNKSKSVQNRKELIIVVSVVLISLLFWESYFVYPVKLFVVFIHELSHTITTYLTGGNVKKLLFDFNLSGKTITTGGNVILIAASGYLGSLVIGSLLVLGSKNQKIRIWTTTSLAITFLIAGVNLVQGGFYVFLFLLSAVFFFLVPRYFNELINSIIWRILGLTSCFYILTDIKHDLITTSLRETDTQILEYILGIPGILIGMFWFIISAGVIFLLLRNELKQI